MGKSVRVCPRCGSTDKVLIGILPPGTAFIGGVAPSGNYPCNNCGYEGVFPVIDESELESFRNDLKKK